MEALGGARRLTGDEPLHGTGATVKDFWAWAHSDLLMNVNRGTLAEWLVGSALGVVKGVRVSWDAFDLLYRGLPIEVKSSAYVQAWEQVRPTVPTFDIGAALEQSQDEAGAWISGTERVRPARAYVFCLFAETDRSKASTSVLDVKAWEFYVIRTARLNTELGTQKKMGISTLQQLAEPVLYSGLRSAVDEAIGWDRGFR